MCLARICDILYRLMFNEEITKLRPGLYSINGTSFVPHERGFGPIEEKFDMKYIVTPSHYRVEKLKEVLHKYGMYDTAELVSIIAEKESSYPPI